MKKKNILMIALSLCLVSIIAVGGTLAYFTDNTDKKVNTFTTGQVAIEIVDETPAGPVNEEVPEGPQMVTGNKDNKTGNITYEDVMPGDVISKTVGVTVNDESQEAWVAIKVDVTATPAADSNLSVEDAQDAVWALIDAQVDATAWEKDPVNNSSAIFYFTEPVVPSVYDEENDKYVSADVTKILFDRLQIPGESWNNNFAEIRFDINVQAFAVQADNLNSLDTAAEQINALIAKTPAPLG